MKRNHGLRSRWSGMASVALIGMALSLSAAAQSTAPKVRVNKVQAQKVVTPFYKVNVDSRAQATGDWLVFLMEYQTQGGTGKSADGKAGWQDEVTVEWNILIPRKEGKDLLLRKKVTYVDVEDKKTVHLSDLYLRPAFFKRQMKGVRPSEIKYYVLVKINGQTEAKYRFPERDTSKWWEWEPPQVQIVDDLQTRDQTPFAPVEYDFFEAIKPSADAK